MQKHIIFIGLSFFWELDIDQASVLVVSMIMILIIAPGGGVVNPLLPEKGLNLGSKFVYR